MNAEQFAQLAAKGYNRIPVVYEALADLDTPLSTYLKLAAGPYSYLLESAHGGEKWGRYSIIGLPCRTVIKVNAHRVTVETGGEIEESLETSDPLAFVEAFAQRYRVPELPELPRFYGGLVGYFGYDCVRYVEKRLAEGAPPDPLDTPDILLMVSEDLVVFDNLKGRMQIISLVDPAIPTSISALWTACRIAAKRWPTQHRRYRNRAPTSPFWRAISNPNSARGPSSRPLKKFASTYAPATSCRLCWHSVCPFLSTADPITLYRALRSLNPSPYMYFMDLRDFQIVSSSPEILARLEDGQIINRPLAGTRRRGHTPEEDKALEEELLADPKELAEHLMLIDLGRNDVGRVSETGSVEVTEQFVIERYSHVMHISSNVVGRLKPGKTAMDVLQGDTPGRHSVRGA